VSQHKQFYNEEMTGDILSMWFCSVIPKLEPESATVQTATEE